MSESYSEPELELPEGDEILEWDDAGDIGAPDAGGTSGPPWRLVAVGIGLVVVGVALMVYAYRRRRFDSPQNQPTPRIAHDPSLGPHQRAIRGVIVEEPDGERPDASQLNGLRSYFPVRPDTWATRPRHRL